MTTTVTIYFLGKYRPAPTKRGSVMRFHSELKLGGPAAGQCHKTLAERQWQKPTMAPVAQKPCDHGLFSDDAKQTDLLDLTQRLGANCEENGNDARKANH